MATGFSPRKAAPTIYIMQSFEPHGDLMERLGKYKTDRSCLYVKRLSDINLDVLETLVAESCEYLRQRLIRKTRTSSRVGRRTRQ